jgi:hypothetical protein
MIAGFQSASLTFGMLSLIITGYIVLVLPTTAAIGAVTGLVIKLINRRSNKTLALSLGQLSE